MSLRSGIRPITTKEGRLSSAISWNFCLVNSGMEEIVVRRNGKELYHGTVPAGFSMHLTIGDSVLVRRGGRLIKKFDLRIWREKPYLRFGERYGKSNQYIKLVGGDNE